MLRSSVKPLASSIARIASRLEQQSTTRLCQSHFSTLLTGEDRSKAIGELQGANYLASWEEVRSFFFLIKYLIIRLNLLESQFIMLHLTASYSVFLVTRSECNQENILFQRF